MHPPVPLDESTPLIVGPDALKGNTVYIYIVACLSAVGGFLFGYDTGVISGAMIFLRDVFDLNEWWQEAVVSSTLLAAWIFSILSGKANDIFGRKPVILLSSLVFVLGSLLLAFAWDKLILLIGRLVVGAGVGLASMTVPMYIAEVAPSSIRGKLVMINMCCITGGQFIASIVAYWFSLMNDGNEWRYMLGVAAIPAALQFFAFLGMPESPRWLIAKRKYEEAKLVLSKIRPEGADTDAEFETIKRNHLEAKQEQEKRTAIMESITGQTQSKQTTWQRILCNPPVRKALLLGCLLQLIQQVSGINTVMYYTASIFEMSGVYSKQKALLYSAGTALVNFLFTIVGYNLVEKVGRRMLTLCSLFGVIVSLLTLAASFQIAYHNSPKVTEIDHAQINNPCDTFDDCSSCSQLPQCGFCFATTTTTPTPNQTMPFNYSTTIGTTGTTATTTTNYSSTTLSTLPSVSALSLTPTTITFAPSGTGSNVFSTVKYNTGVLYGSCLHINATHKDRSVLGQCIAGSNDKYIWALEWCPSRYSWITIIGMACYLMFFAPGMGPMPWTINSEIYPSWARSWCLSASTSVNWLFNLLMSMTFLSLTRAITKHGAFYLYASMASVGFIYFLIVLPETKGKTLEELEHLFDASGEEQSAETSNGNQNARKEQSNSSKKEPKT